MKDESLIEARRIEELYSFNILNSEKEKCFDEILFMATVLSDAPLGYISLVDSTYQWFKTTKGIAETGILLKNSLWESANGSAKIFHSNELQSHRNYEVFRDCLSLPELEFFMEMPISTANNCVIGTLCLLDTRKKSLSKDQEKALDLLTKKLIEILVKQKAEKEFRNTIGEMTSRIAHEINNPLSIIMGNCQHLTNQINKDQLVKNSMLQSTSRINSSAVRIENIIKSMKLISQPVDESQFEKVSVAGVVRDTLDIFEENFIKEGIVLRVSNHFDVFWYGNPTHLSQVLFNLINNAFHAIEHNQEKWIAVDVRVSADALLSITVTDSGKGIDKEIAGKIMKPFFTTKSAGKGTGLGLSICKEIIETYRGDLSVDHKCPNTRFLIKLPIGG